MPRFPYHSAETGFHFAGYIHPHNGFLPLTEVDFSLTRIHFDPDSGLGVRATNGAHSDGGPALAVDPPHEDLRNLE